MGVVFLDTETTGLSPHFHEIWEVGLIVDETEHLWQLPVELKNADPDALRIGRYYERADLENTAEPDEVAAAVAELTANRHLVGAVPSFDAAFLSRFLHRNGYKEAWHYHLIDVEALAVGYLARRRHEAELPTPWTPPWDSEAISRAIGVDLELFYRHTALGDARWVKAIYEAVVG